MAITIAASTLCSGEHLQGVPSGDTGIQLGGSDGVVLRVLLWGRVVGLNQLLVDLVCEGPVCLFREVGDEGVHEFNFKMIKSLLTVNIFTFP